MWYMLTWDDGGRWGTLEAGCGRVKGPPRPGGMGRVVRNGAPKAEAGVWHGSSATCVEWDGREKKATAV